MTIWNHKKDENSNWIVTRDDKKIIDVPNQALGEELELIFAEIEEEYLTELNKANIAMQASIRVAEYYQALISNTLSDKLNDIDNIYAMKKMLEETADTFEDLITKLEKVKDKIGDD